jgi:hypothetical protein
VTVVSLDVVAVIGVVVVVVEAGVLSAASEDSVDTDGGDDASAHPAIRKLTASTRRTGRFIPIEYDEQ